MLIERRTNMPSTCIYATMSCVCVYRRRAHPTQMRHRNIAIVQRFGDAKFFFYAVFHVVQFHVANDTTFLVLFFITFSLDTRLLEFR